MSFLERDIPTDDAKGADVSVLSDLYPKAPRAKTPKRRNQDRCLKVDVRCQGNKYLLHDRLVVDRTEVHSPLVEHQAT